MISRFQLFTAISTVAAVGTKQVAKGFATLTPVSLPDGTNHMVADCVATGQLPCCETSHL